MSEIDIDALRKLAEAASKTGEWYDAGCGTVESKNPRYDEIAHPFDSSVVPYLEAVQPATILALLDRLQKAEARAVPAGWVAVPSEPDANMSHAGDCRRIDGDMADSIYYAMVEAAPPPPAPQAAPVERLDEDEIVSMAKAHQVYPQPLDPRPRSEVYRANVVKFGLAVREAAAVAETFASQGETLTGTMTYKGVEFDAQMGRDAERYRWLRKYREIPDKGIPWPVYLDPRGRVPTSAYCSGVTLDAAIDAAMKGEGK